MTKKIQKLYTEIEWKWLEERLADLQKYIDEHPTEDIEDRIETVTSSKGQPVVKVIAKREDALKSWIHALKEYKTLLLEVEEARKQNAEKLSDVRKGSSINGILGSKLEENTE